MSNQARAQRDRGLALAGLALVLVALMARPAHAQEAAAPARGGPSVEQAVRLALERNKDLLSSAENVEAASGIKKQALQLYLPRLSAGASYSHNFNSTGFFDPTTQQFIAFGNDNYGVRYVLTRTSSTSPRSRRSTPPATSSRPASSITSSRVRPRAARQAAVLRAAGGAGTRDRCRTPRSRSPTGSSQRTQSLFELGMARQERRAQGAGRVSQSQLDVIRDHGNVRRRARPAGEHARTSRPSDDLPCLGSADGRRRSTSTRPRSSRTRSRTAPICRRPEELGSREVEERRRAKIWYFPTVGGQDRVLERKPDKIEPFSGFTEGTRSAVVGLNFPILDGLIGNKGEAQTAEARAEQARYAYERLRLDIGVELRGAINTARQANEGLLVAKSGLESAEEDLKLSQEKYNVGSGTILDLLDAQVNLQRSDSSTVVALTQARIAEAQIERARGVIP
jgi:hypothetical protein